MPLRDLLGVGVRVDRALRTIEGVEKLYSVETDSYPIFVVPSTETGVTELGDGLQGAMCARCLAVIAEGVRQYPRICLAVDDASRGCVYAAGADVVVVIGVLLHKISSIREIR